ncbi:MAG: DNA polymerase III subunit, partial [Actinomycetota bacterium]|nr:DNA polymerase III subunit [Actinomycetota bacterium]
MSWDILHHEWAVRMLQQHIRHSQLKHAYLFTGPPGVGRRTLALRFCQALNCINPPVPGEACGVCRACTLTMRMQHPDLALVEAEREGGVIRVEQARELQRSLSLSPYEARYRVALLLRFHEANHNTQNALLKTLEEPPERVILLLTADTPESLLATISSRCEILRLRPMPLPRLAELLETRHGIPSAEARLLAHLAAGRVGVAIRYHESPELNQRRLGWLEDIYQLLRENQRQRFAFAEATT